MTRTEAMRLAAKEALRLNPEATAEELLDLTLDICDEWYAELASEREEMGIEDSPTVQHCDDWGTGEGRHHGRM